MDWSPLIATLIAGAFAVLPRVPALSADGRARSAIQADVALWAAMPEGAAREKLRENIDARTVALISKREEETALWAGWVWATTWVSIGLGALILASAITSTEPWLVHVRDLLNMLGLAVALTGVVLLLLVVLALVLKGLTWVFEKFGVWLAGRRALRRARRAAQSAA